MADDDNVQIGLTGLPGLTPDEPDVAESEESKWSGLDIAASAVRSQNVLGSMIYGPDGAFDFRPQLPAVEGYDALDDLEEQYQPYAESFIYADNPEETAWIKRKIDMEMADRQVLQEAGGWGIAASVGAGVFDPINFVPVAGAGTKFYQAGKFGQNLWRAAGVGTTAAVITEVPLQLSQETRTIEESFMNVAGSAIFMGGLSSTGYLFRSAFTPDDVAAYMDDAVDATKIIRDEDFYDDVGAARVRAPDEEIVPGGAAAGRAAIDMGGDTFVGRITGKLKSPAMRLLGATSNRARRIFTELAEHPFILKAHERGLALRESVELRVRAYDGITATAVRNLRRGWLDYKKIAGVSGREARDQYYKEVTSMLYTIRRGGTIESIRASGGRYTDEHLNHIYGVAQRIKNDVFDEIGTRAKKAGLFGDDVDPTDMQLAQVWNHRAIINDLDGFNGRVAQWLVNENQIARQAELDDAVKAWRLEQRPLDEGFADYDEAMRVGYWDDLADAEDEFIEGFSYRTDELSVDEATAYAPQVTENVLGNRTAFPTDVIPDDAVAKIRNRKLNIREFQQGDFEGYLEMNTEELVRAYVHGMRGDIEFKAQFGNRDLGDQIDEIRAEYRDLIAKNPDQAAALDKEMKVIIKDLEFMRDSLLGRKQPVGSFSRWMLGINALRSLGGMTISAFGDIGRPIMVHGFRNLGRAFTRTMGSLGREQAGNISAVQKDMFKKFGVAVEWEMNSRFQLMWSGSDNISGPRAYNAATWITRKFDWLSETFGRATGMDQWNDVWKRTAAVMSQQRNIDQIAKLLDGTISAGEKTRLARLGIDEEIAERIARQLRKKNVKINDRGLTVVDYDVFDDAVAREAMQNAILRESLEIINTPTIATMPRWAQEDGFGALLMQYKSFLVTSHQQTLIAGLQRSDMNSLMGVSTMITLGMFSRMTKNALRYRSWEEFAEYYEDADWEQLTFEAVDQSGVLSIPMLVANISDDIANNAILGEKGLNWETDSYYANDITKQLIPTMSFMYQAGLTAGAGIEAAVGADGWSERDTKRAIKLLPYSNVFWLDNAMRTLSESYDEMMTPEKR